MRSLNLNVSTISPLVLTWLICGCAPPPDVARPAWCEPTGELASTACDKQRCIGALAIDYVRLEPRGYVVFSLEAGGAVDAKQALSIADRHVREVIGVQTANTECNRADDFFHCDIGVDDDNNDRYLVIVDGLSGSVLFAGLEIWADNIRRGFDFPLPDDFNGPAPLGCVAPFRPPDRRRLVTTGEPLGSDPASTSTQALEIALKTNFTSRFVGDQSYRALVISHAAARGEFDPESADWYVWLSLR